MELKDKSGALSEDEDDLEKLRLAALQTIKRNVHEESENIFKCTSKHFHNHHKRRKFQGRNPRNGQFYARQKNTNLIAIPTIGEEPDDALKNSNKTKFNNNNIHKLVLPQDRYFKSKNIDDKPIESSSKFDRYDNSDKSESESECDGEDHSESGLPCKIEKASSLEALLQELDNEIQGESKLKDEDMQKRVKTKKPKHKLSTSEVSKENSVQEDTSITNENAENKNNVDEGMKVKKVEKEVKLDLNKEITNLNSNCRKSVTAKNNRKNHYSDRNVNNSATFASYHPYTSSTMFPGDIHFNQGLNYQLIVPYDNNLSLHQSLTPLTAPPNYVHPITTITSFDRPSSPLSLNTNDVLTITRAPLSPRSAAFVLQNREIIERRKKSPRRSYSRSPSPRYRKSKSPINFGRKSRSMSPRKYPKSKSRSPQTTTLESSSKSSPVKEKTDAIREWRLSPVSDRKSPLLKTDSPLRSRRSPLRNKVSPHRSKFYDKCSPNTKRAEQNERSPKTVTNSPKATVRDRLGAKANRKNSVDSNHTRKPKKRCRTLSPVLREVEDKHIDHKEDVVDPILEARRKKFESNEIKNVEGIIRLKPKIEISIENKNVKESIANNDDVIQEDEVMMDLLDAKVDDLFSDEDTDEENEGRFKSNLSKPKQLCFPHSFAQLLDSSTKNTSTEVLKNTNQITKVVDSDCTSNKTRKRQRSRSPLKNKDVRNYKDRTKNNNSKIDSTRKASAKDKQYAKNRILFRNGSSRKEKPPMTTPRENKKIEIKIRNPSKYETTSKYDVANEHETLERIERNVRKVEVSNTKRDIDEENDSEVNTDARQTAETLDAPLSQKSEAAGDLRAQLSRKRAERQSKLPIPEDVQSRLLQSALQGAVFKKPKKSRKERESAPKDGKLPIHFRLGYANSIDIFEEKDMKRKRSKSKGRIEQVFYFTFRLLIDSFQFIHVYLIFTYTC